MELVETEEPVEGEDAESVRGYFTVNQENMEQFCKDEEVARLYHILYKMEDGITVELRNTLWEVVDKILQRPSVQERFKGSDLLNKRLRCCLGSPQYHQEGRHRLALLHNQRSTHAV